jgi:hypothetical protein
MCAHEGVIWQGALECLGQRAWALTQNSHAEGVLRVKHSRLFGVGTLRYDESSGALTMIVPKNWVHQSQLPDFSSLYQYAGPEASSVGLDADILALNPPPKGEVPWAALLFGGLAFVGLVALTSDSEPNKRYCGACGRSGHIRSKCPYFGPRANFSRSEPKSCRCQCCGKYRYETQRHHPRGRADASDRLDVCGDCHVECGHDGHYRNVARKPYVCRTMNRPSAWRDRTNL